MEQLFLLLSCTHAGAHNLLSYYQMQEISPENGFWNGKKIKDELTVLMRTSVETLLEHFSVNIGFLHVLSVEVELTLIRICFPHISLDMSSHKKAFQQNRDKRKFGKK